MISISLLNKWGINNTLIDFYCDKKKMEIIDNKVNIIDDDLIIRIFFDLLNNNINDVELLLDYIDQQATRDYCYLLFYLFIKNLDYAKLCLRLLDKSDVENRYLSDRQLYNTILYGENNDIKIYMDDNEYLKKYIDLIKKYIRLNQYEIVRDILSMVLSIEDNIRFNILNNILDCFESNNNYIVDELDIIDSATIDGLKKMERKLLIALELEDYDTFFDIFYKLKKIYQDSGSMNVINALLSDYNNLIKNYRSVGKTNLLGAVGSFDDVLLGVLKSHDYYRTYNLIMQYYGNTEYSIKLELYKILIERILIYNKRNNGFIKKELTLSTSLDNTMKLLSKYQITSIRVEDLYEDVEDEIDLRVNYYDIYKKCFDEGKYLEAKKALTLHKTRMRVMNIRVDLDYLFKELDYYIANIIYIDNNKEDIRELLNKANLACEDKKYKEAISLFVDVNQFVSKNNPRILSKIAWCYKELGEYISALEYYLDAERDFLYPEDYVGIIECLLELKEYSKVHEYVLKYEHYYPEENAYIYYLLSIAYVNLKEYDLALDALGTVESINVLFHNIAVPCEEERELISKLKNGENVKIYTREDFINYDLTETDKQVEKDIAKLDFDDESFLDVIIDYYNYQGYTKEKLEYLFSVLKILNVNERETETRKLIAFMSRIILETSMPEEELNSYKKVLSIYKKSCN